jgi:RES domain-containing protein
VTRSYRLAYTDSLLAAFRPRGAQARWNSEGTVIVYTSEHPALAALEILNGWEVYANLRGYHLYRCTFETALVCETATSLDIHDRAATRTYGDAWVRKRESVALKAPSVAVAESSNYLFNPNHPDFLAKVKLEHLGPFSFDERVERLVQKSSNADGGDVPR